MKKITIIDCSENIHREVDEIVQFLAEHFKEVDTKFDKLRLSDLNIIKCNECIYCTQKRGNRSSCILEDEMCYVIDKIESSDSYIIISDTKSILTPNKIYDKFSKRLTAYYYSSKDARKALSRSFPFKKSVLINYNSSGFFRNMSFSISKEKMKNSSTAIGAEVIDSMMMQPTSNLLNKYKTRITNMTNKLILL